MRLHASVFKSSIHQVSRLVVSLPYEFTNERTPVPDQYSKTLDNRGMKLWTSVTPEVSTPPCFSFAKALWHHGRLGNGIVSDVYHSSVLSRATRRPWFSWLATSCSASSSGQEDSLTFSVLTSPFLSSFSPCCSDTPGLHYILRPSRGRGWRWGIVLFT